MNKTTLTKSQKKLYTAQWEEGKNRYSITATVRHDDQCGNGHNTFALTADIRENGREYMGGCCHEEVAKRIPELAPFIKWHLTSTDGPMHYEANTVYHAKQGKLDYARSTAIWPNATLEQLLDKEALEARLPMLLEEFQLAVESLGLVY